MGDQIRITGLVELQAALKAIDGESQKQLRVVFNEAAQTVVTAAQGRVPVRTGAARASIRVASGQRSAAIKAGGAKVPYFGWLDFGGRRAYEKHAVRPFMQDGRYLYAAFYAHKADVMTQLQAALVALAESKGLKVDG